MNPEKMEQLKEEIRNKLPEIRFKKGELEQNIPELQSVLSEILQKHGVSGAVEFKRKSNSIEIKLKTNKPNVRAAGFFPNFGTAPTFSLGGITERCPCDPGDHPNDCCWVSI